MMQSQDWNGSAPSGKYIIIVLVMPQLEASASGSDDVLGKVLEADKMSVEQSAFHWKSVLDPFKEHLGEYMENRLNTFW